MISEVGGLPASVRDNAGSILAPSHEPVAIRRAAMIRGCRFSGPHSWSCAIGRYATLVARTRQRPGIHERE